MSLAPVTALTKREVEFSSDQVELIKKTVMPPFKKKGRDGWEEEPGTDEELQLFLYICKNKGLNPLTKQIYAIRNREGKLTFMTSIDGLRIEANRTGLYQGQLGPFWCGPEGQWSDVWLGDGYPTAAKVGILRKGFTEPIWGTAKFKTYAQYTYRDNKQVLSGFWAKGDEHMLAKCAEANALRRAFPEDIGGANALYIAEESWAIQHDPSEETQEEVLERKLKDLKAKRAAQEKPQEQPALPPKAVIPAIADVVDVEPEPATPEPPAGKIAEVVDDSQIPQAEKFHVYDMEIRKKAGKEFMWLKVGDGPMDVLSCWHSTLWYPPKEGRRGYLWEAKGRDCEFYIRTSKGYRNVEGIAKIGRRTFTANAPDLDVNDDANKLEY